MNRNTTLILVGVFALLLLYVLVIQRPAEEAQLAATPTTGPSTTGTVWGALTADKILSVAIESRLDGRRVAFGRPDPAAAWEVTAPETRPADQVQAATQVGTLANLTYLRTLLDSGGLETYGVLTPSYVIEIEVTDGPAVKAFVGDRTPTNNAYYVSIEGQPDIMVVNSATLDSILNTLSAPPYLQPTATPDPLATEILVATPTP